jgi:tryptophanyl-tRNA synthetase
MLSEVDDWCVNAKRGCRECKTILAGKLETMILPRRAKKEELLKNKTMLEDILSAGVKKARAAAQKTLHEVKAVMGLRDL